MSMLAARVRGDGRHVHHDQLRPVVRVASTAPPGPGAVPDGVGAALDGGGAPAHGRALRLAPGHPRQARVCARRAGQAQPPEQAGAQEGGQCKTNTGIQTF